MNVLFFGCRPFWHEFPICIWRANRITNKKKEKILNLEEEEKVDFRACQVRADTFFPFTKSSVWCRPFHVLFLPLRTNNIGGGGDSDNNPLATTKKPSEDIRRPPLRPLSVAYFLSDKAIYSHPMVPRELTWPADPSHTADEPHDPLWSPQNL